MVSMFIGTICREYGKPEVFQLQEDLELDIHEEDTVNRSENEKIVQGFVRMILELIEKAK